MPNRLSGQVAAVTGAGRGLGRAYALALAAEGAAVVVNDKGTAIDGMGADQEPAEQVVREIVAMGGKAVASYDDVSDFKAAGRIVEAALKNFGRLDVMIPNAGADRRGPILDFTPEEWERTLKIHLFGSINCAVQAGRAMRDQGRGGAITIITSEAFYVYPRQLAPYAVSKGGTYSLMRGLAHELEPFGISVNAISPSGRTRQTDEYTREHLARTANLTEAEIEKRLAASQGPEVVGPLAVFLATAEGRRITGRVFALRRDSLSMLLPPQETLVARAPSGHWDVEELVKTVPQLVKPGLEEVPSPSQVARSGWIKAAEASASIAERSRA